MSQAALFAPPPKAPRLVAYAQVRAPVVLHGTKDKAGRLWWERFAEEVKALPQDSQAVLLEMLLEWPADRMDAVRLMLDRWTRAQPLERDNFAEAFGR